MRDSLYMIEFCEREYFKVIKNKKYSLITCDEVGRGPIAGPVISCSVHIPLESLTNEFIERLSEIGVTDSKKVSEKKREKIINAFGFKTDDIQMNQVYKAQLDGHAFSFVVKQKSAPEIDKINILQASLLSMKEGCVDLVASAPKGERGIILIDGNQKFTWPTSSFAVVSLIGGDAKSRAIGLASIIAKQFRDHLMKELGELYPGYGLERHAGYPTKAHKEAVQELGVLPIHRKSFKGVKEHVTV